MTVSLYAAATFQSRAQICLACFWYSRYLLSSRTTAGATARAPRIWLKQTSVIIQDTCSNSKGGRSLIDSWALFWRFSDAVTQKLAKSPEAFCSPTHTFQWFVLDFELFVCHLRRSELDVEIRFFAAFLWFSFAWVVISMRHSHLFVARGLPLVSWAPCWSQPHSLPTGQKVWAPSARSTLVVWWDFIYYQTWAIWSFWRFGRVAQALLLQVLAVFL